MEKRIHLISLTSWWERRIRHRRIALFRRARSIASHVHFVRFPVDSCTQVSPCQVRAPIPWFRGTGSLAWRFGSTFYPVANKSAANHLAAKRKGWKSGRPMVVAPLLLGRLTGWWPEPCNRTSFSYYGFCKKTQTRSMRNWALRRVSKKLCAWPTSKQNIRICLPCECELH